MFKDYFSFALGTISHRKTRSWLTMVGIFIGIAAVVALISLGQGFKQAINKEFERLGTDKLFITSKSGFGAPGTNAAIELTTDDKKIVKKVSGIENVAGTVFVNSKVEFEDNVGFYLIHSFPKGEERKLEAEVCNQGVAFKRLTPVENPRACQYRNQESSCYPVRTRQAIIEKLQRLEKVESKRRAREEKRQFRQLELSLVNRV